MITQQLIELIRKTKQNELSSMDQSLMHGNSGLCLFLYHLSRKENNALYEQMADDLLDEVFVNIRGLKLTDFENGLSGIGWIIEYLVQNGFAEGNTDDILEEIDSEVFKILKHGTQKSFELTNGLTGYLFYLISRLKRPINPDSMSQQINRDLFIHSINILDILVTNQFIEIIKEMSFDLFWRFPVMLYSLILALDLNIYNEKIELMIKQWVYNFEAFLPSMHINRLYMATILYIVNSRVSDMRLEKQIKILLFATDFEVLETEIDPDKLNIRYGWPGVVWLLRQASKILPQDYPNYNSIMLSCENIRKKFEGSLESLQISDATAGIEQLSISDGVIGIDLLDLVFPEVYSNKIS